MMHKSQAKIKPSSRIYDFKEDIHEFFSQFSILNLCSEIYFFEGAIYLKLLFSRLSILNLCSEMYFLRGQFIHNFFSNFRF